jgi:hypothetical protein
VSRSLPRAFSNNALSLSSYPFLSPDCSKVPTSNRLVILCRVVVRRIFNADVSSAEVLALNDF